MWARVILAPILDIIFSHNKTLPKAKFPYKAKPTLKEMPTFWLPSLTKGLMRMTYSELKHEVKFKVKNYPDNKNCKLPMGLKLTMSKNQLQASNSSSLAFLLQVSVRPLLLGAFVNDTCSQETPGIWKVSTLISKPKHFIAWPIHTCFQTATNK